MNEPTVKNIIAELSDRLIGQKFGKIFVLSKTQLAIDFRLPDGQYLFISAQPNSPRLYLIKRRLKELEKASAAQPSFVSILRKRLAHAIVESIEKIESERVIKFKLAARSELGDREQFTLVIQLTGRSSNLFLLDERDFILDSLRETHGNGQIIATTYSHPTRKVKVDENLRDPFPRGEYQTLSQALDEHYRERDSLEKFRARAKAAKNSIARDLKKKLRLRKALHRDLDNHGDPEKWKHFGDVLLANVSTAKRQGESVLVVDYFDENNPTIEIPADENDSITKTAEKYFKRYTKARNAKKEIAKRLEKLSSEIETLEEKKTRLLEAIDVGDSDKIDSFIGIKRKSDSGKDSKKKEVSFSGAKKYVSSDGFEILVGKRSKDNDYLTFRIAKSLDTWLHAADYPGSHVVVRNPNRKEIPQKTLFEAAQLAAFYSKAKKEAKVGVHYTQKKFVNKPKGAAPGLVSLASFKTILVEPKVAVKRKDG